VWMEDPGYLGARSALAASGAELTPLADASTIPVFCRRGPSM
jgi:DNA-binding transcriptional MocR family regulator